MNRSIPLLVVAALALGACRNPPPPQEPQWEEPIVRVPAQDVLQVAADEDAARREAEAAAASAEPPGPPPVPEVDKTFAVAAAGAGIAEVELSKVALQRAKKAAIKQLAQMMIDEHDKVNQELTALASARGVELPGAPDAVTLERRATLEKLNGTKLERAYVDHMLADHRKAIELFRAETTNGVDPEFTEWAKRTLPKLEEHLGHAEAVASGKPRPSKGETGEPTTPR